MLTTMLAGCLTKMFKPTRGLQKPKRDMFGVSPWALIKFMEEAREACKRNNDEDAAYKFDRLVDFFRNDFNPDKPLKFNGSSIGL